MLEDSQKLVTGNAVKSSKLDILTGTQQTNN